MNPSSLLQRRIHKADGTVGHNRMSAAHRGYVDHDDLKSSACRFQRGAETRDARAYDQDVGRICC